MDFDVYSFDPELELAVLACSGEDALGDDETIRNAFQRELEDGAVFFVLDMKEVSRACPSFPESTSAVAVQCARMRTCGGNVLLVNPPPNFCESLRRMDLDIMRTFSSVAQAVAAVWAMREQAAERAEASK